MLLRFLLTLFLGGFCGGTRLGFSGGLVALAPRGGGASDGGVVGFRLPRLRLRLLTVTLPPGDGGLFPRPLSSTREGGGGTGGGVALDDDPLCDDVVVGGGGLSTRATDVYCLWRDLKLLTVTPEAATLDLAVGDVSVIGLLLGEPPSDLDAGDEVEVEVNILLSEYLLLLADLGGGPGGSGGNSAGGVVGGFGVLEGLLGGLSGGDATGRVGVTLNPSLFLRLLLLLLLLLDIDGPGTEGNSTTALGTMVSSRTTARLTKAILRPLKTLLAIVRDRLCA
jgi:hypothetical protein